MLDLIQDHKRQLEKSNVSTKLLYEFEIEEQEQIPIRQDDFSADIFINADKNRIIQVLDNLLTNAIKFTKDGIVSISITCKIFLVQSSLSVQTGICMGCLFVFFIPALNAITSDDDLNKKYFVMRLYPEQMLHLG